MKREDLIKMSYDDFKCLNDRDKMQVFLDFVFELRRTTYDVSFLEGVVALKDSIIDGLKELKK